MLLLNPVALVRSSVSTSARLTSGGVALSLRAARSTLAVSAAAASAATAALTGTVVRRREVWSADGHALVEVHGLGLAEGQRVRSAVETAITGLGGVSWAVVEPVTARLQVRFDPELVTVDDLVEAVADAELSAGVEQQTSAAEAGEFPADEAPLHRQALGVLANLAGLTAATAGQIPGLPALPGSAAAAVALLDTQPRLRRLLETRLGPAGTDLALAGANAAVLGLSHGTTSLLVDTALRAQTLLASGARRSAFLSREDELCGPHRPAPRPAPPHAPRPVPRPPGPIERVSDRAAVGSLLTAGGLLAATRDLDLAGHVTLVGVPRAARFGREGFANALGYWLARSGTVVLDESALRRLDRVSALVVDSAVLDGPRPLVLHARELADGWTREQVWSAAQRLLWAEAHLPVPPPLGRQRERLSLVPPDGDAEDVPPGATSLELREDGRPVGLVTVAAELDPYADAVLSAGRSAGLRLVVSARASLTQLAGRADEVLPPDVLLVDRVRALQAEGEMVAVLGQDLAALSAADVGLGVLPESSRGRVPWSADIVCGPGLPDAHQLLQVLPAARSASQRGVTLALGGGFLGALLLALSVPGSRSAAELPGTFAAAVAQAEGTWAATRAMHRPGPVPQLHIPWHALEPDEVLARLPRPAGTGPAEEASSQPLPGEQPSFSRRVPAVLQAPARLIGGLTRNVAAELADPLTPVLTTGAAASAVIGSPVDSFLVGGVLAANAVISGAQRLRADRALRSLLLDQQLTARLVPADGTQPVVISARVLLPGHVIELRPGDVVPADARLLDEVGLEVDEATLTGEPIAVGKQVLATPGAELPDRACMVYEGTTVLAGSGTAVVVGTGDTTEAGRALAVAGNAALPAGMQVRLQELTRKALPVTLLGGAAVTGLGLLRGQSPRAAIASGVSVAVAAVPEGLPLVATVAQLSAARRLSRLGILVRSSRTVEALGRVDTLCFDKTGTLTEGRLRLVRVGGLSADWSPAAPEARRVLLAAARACPQPDGQQPLPHATDRAVLDAAREALGGDLDEDWEELTEVPFQSDRGYSAALGRRSNGYRLVVKGAPEVLLPRCTHVRENGGKLPLDRAGRRAADQAVERLAAQGLRVLAVARRRVRPAGVVDAATTDTAELTEDLTLLGFVALADVARPQAAPTVAALRSAGLATVMITGDHPVTARAIASGLGIPAERVVTGAELEAVDDQDRTALATSASVFARVSPEQKVRIVAALRRAGRVVAMTGDGANDAAAIRVADVGIGVGASGSTSARTAADVVLTEPDIALILDALVEGRAMWGRVRDAVSILVGGNAGEVAFTLAGTAISGRAPISTRQFLLVNLLTDLAPSMAVAVAPTDRSRPLPELLARPVPSLGRPLLEDIGVRGAATSAGALVAWQIGRFTGRRRRASTIALASLVGTQLGQTLFVARNDRTVAATGLGSAAALAVVIQTPGVSQFFGCTPLGPVAWVTVVGSAAAGTAAALVLPRLLTSAGDVVASPPAASISVLGQPAPGRPILTPTNT